MFWLIGVIPGPATGVGRGGRPGSPAPVVGSPAVVVVGAMPVAVGVVGAIGATGAVVVVGAVGVMVVATPPGACPLRTGFLGEVTSVSTCGMLIPPGA